MKWLAVLSGMLFMGNDARRFYPMESPRKSSTHFADGEQMRNFMRAIPWLCFVLMMIGCTKPAPPPPPPPVDSPRLVALEKRVTELGIELARVNQYGVETDNALRSLLDIEAKRAAKAAKPPAGGGFTDCWTSYEHGSTYRNCRDAQGNTSKRNF